GPQPYPFDAGPARLALALLEAAPGHTIPGGDKPPFAWLPTTTKGVPPPSSGMIADVASDGPPELAPWIITALPLPGPLALDLLCACVGQEHLAQGVHIGPTLAFWTRALQFAGALVGREQFVPGLRQANGSWRSIWQPVIAGPDSQRFGRL